MDVVKGETLASFDKSSKEEVRASIDLIRRAALRSKVLDRRGPRSCPLHHDEGRGTRRKLPPVEDDARPRSECSLSPLRSLGSLRLFLFPCVSCVSWSVS